MPYSEGFKEMNSLDSSLPVQENNRQARGYYGALLNGLLAVILFSLTVPMTKIALAGSSPELITLIRAFISGLASLFMAKALGWSLPNKSDSLKLVIGGVAVTCIFPYSLALGLDKWSASNMGVILAGVPLITALIAAFLFKERQSISFWVSIFMGALILMHFAQTQSDGPIHWSVFVMLLAAGIGYTLGGQVAKSIGGFKTICWMTIFYLPVSFLGLLYKGSEVLSLFQHGSTNVIFALAYLALISQWLGFHFWYGAMAKVGIAKAGQIQLLQPFFTLLFSVPLLGLVLESEHFVYATLITLTVVVAVRFKK